MAAQKSGRGQKEKNLAKMPPKKQYRKPLCRATK
jgi:hypothetical protein